MTPSTSADYSLPDAITAAALSNFAYRYGEPGVNFTQLLNSNGWNVIATKAAPGLPGHPAGTPDNAFAYAVSRDLSPDKVQFAFALRGSDNPVGDWRDWIWNNASKYSFSHCCQQVREPLAQMANAALAAQASGETVEIIITGHSLGGVAAQAVFAQLLQPVGIIYLLIIIFLDRGF